jgi:Nucleotide modification associated domain 2
MDLYCYVIATDAGSAPNYDLPFTTLAICKPKIRSSARIGDVVLAFAGSNESREPHAVRWTGVIKEKFSFPDYWADRRFAKKKPGKCAKPDNIYQPHPSGEGFLQIPNDIHGPESTVKDVGGQFVLIFDPVWRFAGGSPVMPADFGYRMLKNARRGHRIHPLDLAHWLQLRDWLNEQKPKFGDAAHVDSKRRCEPARSSSTPTSKRKPRRPVC